MTTRPAIFNSDSSDDEDMSTPSTPPVVLHLPATTSAAGKAPLQFVSAGKGPMEFRQVHCLSSDDEEQTEDEGYFMPPPPSIAAPHRKKRKRTIPQDLPTKKPRHAPSFFASRHKLLHGYALELCGLVDLALKFTTLPPEVARHYKTRSTSIARNLNGRLAWHVEDELETEAHYME